MDESVDTESLRELEAHRRLLARDPDSLRFAEYADLLRRLGQLSEAIEVCSSGLARHPHYSTGHVVLGEVLLDFGKVTEAEAEWQKALQLDPGHPRAHVRMGELYLARDDRERAATAFEAALLYSPDYAEARARLSETRGVPSAAQEHKSVEQPTRRPGERPGWLTDDRLGELLRLVRGCASVETAAFTRTDGGVLASGEASPPREACKEGASLVRDARDLLSRLGAGRLRSALVAGATGTLCCVSLGDLLLVAGVRPEATYGQSEQEIEQVVARPPKESEEGGHG